jgi:hypothetical protein
MHLADCLFACRHWGDRFTTWMAFAFFDPMGRVRRLFPSKRRYVTWITFFRIEPFLWCAHPIRRNRED